MSYAAWSVVFGEQPTASKWNILGTNDAEFNSMIAESGSNVNISVPGGGFLYTNKLNIQTNTVATAQNSASDTYADLGTTGPTVTATPGPSGIALAFLIVTASNDTSQGGWSMGVDLSGGNTSSVDDTKSVQERNSTGAPIGRMSSIITFTGLAQSSTTFKCKFKRVNALGTATFSDRTLTIWCV